MGSGVDSVGSPLERLSTWGLEGRLIYMKYLLAQTIIVRRINISVLSIFP